MVRYSFLVGLFHPLLHAGLSRRLHSLTLVARLEGLLKHKGFGAATVSGCRDCPAPICARGPAAPE